MRNKIFLFVGYLMCLAVTVGATKRSVLFIGNSYTSTNNMPLTVQNITTAMGDTLTFGVSDPGGYTLAQHSTYAPTLSLIFSQPWDVVVLQEQSEMPSFPPDQVVTDVYPYARLLDSMIHANDSCTQTMFLMTWGHANGDPPNCGSYPVICTYAGMQQRLHDSYMEMTQANNAIVAPVGVAWRVMMDSFAPAIWLYIPDSSHPAVSGTYLESCVMYSSLFHKRVMGCTYNPGIATSDASTIQRISDKVTMDSLYQWQQFGHYPAAVFSDTCGGMYTMSFTATSGLPASYSWAFGDGVTDTGTAVSHIYPTSPLTYPVSLTASNNCFSETQILQLDLPCNTTGIASNQSHSPFNLLISNQDDHSVSISVGGSFTKGRLEVFTANGIRSGSYQNVDSPVSMRLVPGLYLAIYTDSLTGDRIIKKFVVF